MADDRPPPPPAGAGGTRPQPSDEEIAAMLARVDQPYPSRFAPQRPASPALLGALLKGGVIARLCSAWPG